MGLFDKLFGGVDPSNQDLNKQEGMAAILLAMIAADGHISDEEANGVCAVFSRMKLFEQQSAQQHRGMIDRLFGLLKKQGAPNLLDLGARACPPELRQTAFALAADLVMADGVVQDEEKELLGRLQQQLGIPDDQATKIVEVIVIKNRG